MFLLYCNKSYTHETQKEDVSKSVLILLIFAWTLPSSIGNGLSSFRIQVKNTFLQQHINQTFQNASGIKKSDIFKHQIIINNL